MNIDLALLLFSFIILLYWVITELFTFIFQLTGLPAERARFQVISLLTGTGYTTRESEVIMASCKRAVKGGDSLTDIEIKALIDDMLTTDAPPNCATL